MICMNLGLYVNFKIHKKNHIEKNALNSKRLGQFNNTSLIASTCTIQKPDVRESSKTQASSRRP